MSCTLLCNDDINVSLVLQSNLTKPDCQFLSHGLNSLASFKLLCCCNMHLKPSRLTVQWEDLFFLGAPKIDFLCSRHAKTLTDSLHSAEQRQTVRTDTTDRTVMLVSVFFLSLPRPLEHDEEPCDVRTLWHSGSAVRRAASQHKDPKFEPDPAGCCSLPLWSLQTLCWRCQHVLQFPPTVPRHAAYFSSQWNLKIYQMILCNQSLSRKHFGMVPWVFSKNPILSSGCCYIWLVERQLCPHLSLEILK